jgi:hypothetical protein
MYKLTYCLLLCSLVLVLIVSICFYLKKIPIHIRNNNQLSTGESVVIVNMYSYCVWCTDREVS